MNTAGLSPTRASSAAVPSPADPSAAERQAREAEAVQVALNGSPRARRRVAAKALFRLARNSEDTTQALLLGIALNAPIFPTLLARFAADPDGAVLIEERPSLDSHHVDHAWLRTLPAGTLGREYIRFLDDRGLDSDFFQAPPGVPPLVAFISQRMRQSHDLWHVLTGFSTEVPDEIGLQAFTYIQLRTPSSFALALVGLLRWVWTKPSSVSRARRGVRLGRQAKWLGAVRWETLFEKPLAEVRTSLGLTQLD